GNWDGFITSFVVLSLDLSLYIFSAQHSNGVSEEAKLVLLGLSRVILISFDYDTWFMGVSLVYFLYGSYYLWMGISLRYPYDFLQRDLQQKKNNHTQAIEAAKAAKAQAKAQAMTGVAGI